MVALPMAKNQTVILPTAISQTVALSATVIFFRLYICMAIPFPEPIPTLRCFLSNENESSLPTIHLLHPMMVMMLLRKPLLRYTKHTLNITLSMLHDGVVLYLGVSTFIGTEKVGIGGCTMTISPKIQSTGHLSSDAGLLIAC